MNVKDYTMRHGREEENVSGIETKDHLLLDYAPFNQFNPLNAELNPICCLLALLGAHHFLHISRIRIKTPRPNNNVQ